MEPLSLTGLVLGGLAQTIQLLTKHLESANNSKSIRDDMIRELQVLFYRLQGLEAQIRAWSALWMVSDGTPGSLHESLWGQRGRDEIQMMLRRISLEVRGIQDYVESQYSEKKDWESSPKLKRAYRALRESHNQGKKERMRLVELHSHIADLSSAVESLVAMSKFRYQSTNTALRQGDSITSSIEDILRTRTHSLVLYLCCPPSSSLDTYLNIDLFEDHHNSTPLNSDAATDHLQDKLQYHLLFSQHLSVMLSEDLVLIGLEDNDSKYFLEIEAAGIRQIQNIEEALAVRRNLVDAARILCLPNPENGKSSYFYLRPPQNNLDLDGPPKRLEKFLAEAKNKPFYDSGHLPLSARYDLAFKIVRCGLHLLGTPWLSNLNSSSLLRATTPDKNLYLLSIRISEGWKSQDLSEIDSQVFRIGILLIEIALETPLKLIQPLNNIPTSLSEMAQQAAEVMGSNYGRAVRYCLDKVHQSSLNKRDSSVDSPDEGGRSRLNDNLRNRLPLFYSNVYEPIKESHDVLHERPSPLDRAKSAISPTSPS